MFYFSNKSKMPSVTIAVFSLLVVCAAQRSPYAGKRPIGYPELETTTKAADVLGNRFDEGDTSTQPLPLEALGDRELVNRISKLPVDQQPFWYLNWKALEEERRNPQYYPQRPNPFLSSGNIRPPNTNNIPVVPNTNTRFEATQPSPQNTVTPLVTSRTDEDNKEINFSSIQQDVEDAILTAINKDSENKQAKALNSAALPAGPIRNRKQYTFLLFV